MKFFQKEIKLKARSRGFHIVTGEVENELTELKEINSGMLNVFIKHTSAGITINENADPTVRDDFESHFNEMVPENMPYYKHTLEGADDMPAHIKASLLGSSLQIPVTNGRLNLGTWQGIYLAEHRNNGGSRKLVLSLYGV
ncbi:MULTISPECIES: secondary thiamine-phosphate synthase enzyme YjbQ [Salegentibacter]|jgi:secondary thiamine-phosphate synthase enzyme|uniref:Secondary thiamine-phosphate synthase enzyme n=1 Tax=Salegentibacter agarivorans TaxID=345907 RepID=A0A1I2PD51_9FLAO|nr:MULTISPECIES: secondary thiamine-phosphate synthase enzyme YjbQ [Salegentibacter]APS40407.1 secondary thiamine-phosphate synthase [Salegentibacter sp. T436]SFG11586.1 secondary thiamine-phosphate synthase enzyme [Salegentibacter agarivorans]|tara:strand:- start:220 stop:642 length:423 start_codon:yes stop_codon:yes gene_type:complete